MSIAVFIGFWPNVQCAGTGGYGKEVVTKLRCLRRLSSHELCVPSMGTL